jgi:hypothetical protein
VSISLHAKPAINDCAVKLVRQEIAEYKKEGCLKKGNPVLIAL